MYKRKDTHFHDQALVSVCTNRIGIYIIPHPKLIGVIEMNNLVVIQNNQVVVSSKDIADHFCKHHKDVLENIRHILVAENSATKFFQESSTVYRGREFPIYLMNRDGFSLLAMGFTGKKALQWKLKYIEAFNEMEQQLQAPREEIQLERKTFKGIPVLTTSDMSVLLGIPHGTVLWYCKKYQVEFVMLEGQKLQDYKKENKNQEKFVSKLAVFTKSVVIKILRCVNRYTKDIKKIIEAYFIESLPAPQSMIEKSECISLKHKKAAIDELRKQAKTIDGMLKMLPECKRSKEKHDASIEFVIEGVMSLLLDLQDLRRNMI